jgi:hypothetical protein
LTNGRHTQFETGNDERGLGRWSYIILRSNKQKLAIIMTQQWLLLREQQKDPDPIQEFNNDLNNLLHHWRASDTEIILLIDANEEIGAKPGGISSTITRNALYDLLANQHDTNACPNTYIRGTKRIDYIFGTEKVLKHCKSSGILPFCHGYPSHHRAIFVRVDMQNILQTEVNTMESNAARLLQSASPRERQKFLQELDNHYVAQNLYDCLTQLWSKSVDEWNQEAEIEFNKCDLQHIQGMLAAEKKTCRVKRYAWSPKYGNAVERKKFFGKSS